ncbi:MAG: DUF3108 domain-containing protein [Deltaproteobacteria bacterium]|nr:DUF3108 domain-containing protein [Deltaproteobacteria bacterium]
MERVKILNLADEKCFFRQSRRSGPLGGGCPKTVILKPEGLKNLVASNGEILPLRFAQGQDDGIFGQPPGQTESLGAPIRWRWATPCLKKHFSSARTKFFYELPNDFFWIILVLSLISGCGGFHSVEKLGKIEPPQDFEEVDIDVQTTPPGQKRQEVKRDQELRPGKKVQLQKKKISIFETQTAQKRKAFYGGLSTFKEGERTVYDLTWFAIKAGEATMEVHPYVYVGGRKAYHFVGGAKSSSVMDLIHSIDDWMESYVDVETFYPFKSAIHGIETDRLREARLIFNYDTQKVHYWTKRIHVKKEMKVKQDEDSFEPGLLDLFTCAYYLRAQKLEVGKKYETQVYQEGKRYLIEADVLKREKISTAVGDFEALHIRPAAKFQGILQTEGDSSIWVSDDNRHLVLELETKVKIGYLKGKIKRFEDLTF